MHELFEFLLSSIFDLAEWVRCWRWMVAMLLGAGAAWLLACAIPSRVAGWVCVPLLIVTCLIGIWWESRSA